MDRWSHLRPHLLQLWSLGPLRSRVPEPKKNAAQRHVTHPPRGPHKVAVAKIDRVNCSTMEDVPEGKQVLASMFCLNRHPHYRSFLFRRHS
jgi:hypothetical protein